MANLFFLCSANNLDMILREDQRVWGTIGLALEVLLQVFDRPCLGPRGSERLPPGGLRELSTPPRPERYPSGQSRAGVPGPMITAFVDAKDQYDNHWTQTHAKMNERPRPGVGSRTCEVGRQTPKK